MKSLPLPDLTAEKRQELRDVLKHYFASELEVEIGDLQADLFMEFLDKKIGKYFYNQAVTDTIKSLKERTEDLILLLKD